MATVTKEITTDNIDMWRIQAVNAPWYDGVEIMISGLIKYPTRRWFSLDLSGQLTPIEPGRITPETLWLNRKMAQELLNDLWYCGLRPTIEGSEGQLQATENHLKDMRNISFALLKKVLEDG